jgi:hypothetical protein
MADHPSESVIDLYRRRALQWDVARRSRGWNDRIWIEAFAKRLARGSRVLDLGCAGREPVARFLFHLKHEAQRAMFPVFDAHAAEAAVLMFNTGPDHGEGTSTFTFKDEPLYHASLAPDEYQVLLDDSGFEVVCHAANDARSDGRTAWLCRRKPSR